MNVGFLFCGRMLIIRGHTFAVRGLTFQGKSNRDRIRKKISGTDDGGKGPACADL